MAKDYTNFWWELLRFGSGEDIRRRNWNSFCEEQLNALSGRLISSENFRYLDGKIKRGYPNTKTKESIQNLANEHSLPVSLARYSGPNIESFMDFSDLSIDEDVSFAGRILIGADFRGTCFEQNVNFDDAVFVGLTNFSGAKFRSVKAGLLDGVSFKKSSFLNTAYFNSAEFRFRTRFDGAKFYVGAYFRGTKFESESGGNASSGGGIVFQKCQFSNETDFKKAKFEFGVDFTDSEFQKTANFENAEFRSMTKFNNAKLSGTTSFRNASFGWPPQFFETELHEDTNFSQVDWSTAERSYNRSQRRIDPLSSVTADADYAVRSWDRLALIMSQREKLAERHEFFRLKMRAQRQRDGWSLLSLANWLFDATSDYGWSISRAFSWWAGHIAVGAAALVFVALVSSVFVEQDSPLVLWHGLLVSFANAHAILGLASEGGYLHDARVSLYEATVADGYLDAIGTSQIVLGPIFLFLLLLTLRNRFRIG